MYLYGCIILISVTKYHIFSFVFRKLRKRYLTIVKRHETQCSEQYYECIYIYIYTYYLLTCYTSIYINIIYINVCMYSIHTYVYYLLVYKDVFTHCSIHTNIYHLQCLHTENLASVLVFIVYHSYHSFLVLSLHFQPKPSLK